MTKMELQIGPKCLAFKCLSKIVEKSSFFAKRSKIAKNALFAVFDKNSLCIADGKSAILTIFCAFLKVRFCSSKSAFLRFCRFSRKSGFLNTIYIKNGCF